MGNGKMVHANVHSASASFDDLFYVSDYPKELDSIFEKIGRVDNTSKLNRKHHWRRDRDV